MTLSVAEVKHIAHLARVGLTEEEVAHFQRDLSTVLDWFEELKAADTTDVAPIGHITGEVNVAEKDFVKEVRAEEKKGILAGFPRTQGTALEVRSVF